MKKGFSLFEILVAGAIFAMVMVIATGVIAQMSGYNKKIRVSKMVSEETRKLAEQISADVRSAVGVDKTTYPASPQYGLTIINDDLITVRTKDAIKAYYSYSDSITKAIYFQSWTLAQFPASPSLTNPIFDNLKSGNISNRITNQNTDTTIVFTGLSGGNASSQQPYVRFTITTQTKGYTGLKPYEEAQTLLQSMVTGRGYDK